MSLLNDELKKTLPTLYSTENIKDPIIQCKFYVPNNLWKWYVLEFDLEQGVFFGCVCGFENELGYFSLWDLEVVGALRDVDFKPQSLSGIKRSCNDRDN